MPGVVVVTGSGGMGCAVARRIGSGSLVVLADVNEDAAATTASDLRSEGLDVVSQFVDVSQRESVDELADFSRNRGQISALVHTAGLSPVQASARAIVQVDLLGTAYVLDAFGSVISDGGAGVVIASMAGSMASLSSEFEHRLATTPTAVLDTLPELTVEMLHDGPTAYLTAKRANQLRVQAAAATWGARGARINSISPGVIATPMGEAELASPTGDVMRALVEGSAMRRTGTPHDIAGAVEFLLSPRAAYITGTDLLVDGGVIASFHS
jgi:NAD(P)-dependent dehydrogenase (short-subunit alcohol dehydrogenase family)